MARGRIGLCLHAHALQIEPGAALSVAQDVRDLLVCSYCMAAVCTGIRSCSLTHVHTTAILSLR